MRSSTDYTDSADSKEKTTVIVKGYLWNLCNLRNLRMALLAPHVRGE
ncbi:MAG: hypothetical protein M3539_12635 [Acidobacteriota bacterium]|nr:hypothetical protein [Acidobacteriota bacterium]